MDITWEVLVRTTIVYINTWILLYPENKNVLNNPSLFLDACAIYEYSLLQSNCNVKATTKCDPL